jgi:hypothetical protein
VLLIASIVKVYSQPTKNTDTCYQITSNDKRIWNVVWEVHNQQKETIANKDTLIIIQSGIIMQDSIQLDAKDTTIALQAENIKVFKSIADTEKSARKLLTRILYVETGLILYLLIFK